MWSYLRGREPGPDVKIDREAAGYAIYQRLGCARCHGASLRGTHKAPPLLELARHHDAEGLLRYLENPDSAQIVDPRLNRLDTQFSKHEMPSYPLRIEAAQTLLNFLLAPSIADSADVNDGQNLRH
jgi:mono/diheme cytochrome c family protein